MRYSSEVSDWGNPLSYKWLCAHTLASTLYDSLPLLRCALRMEDESEAAQGQTTATGNASVSPTNKPSDPDVRQKTTTPPSLYIRRECKKGSLQKEIDTSCPLRATRPLYRHQHHTKKAFQRFNQLRKYDQPSLCWITSVYGNYMMIVL